MRSTFKICFLVLIVLLASCHGNLPTGGWIFLGESESGSSFYYDPDSVTYSPEGNTRVWVKQIPTESENIYHLVKWFAWEPAEGMESFERYHHTVLLCEINCLDYTVSSLVSKDYDRDGEILYCSVNDKEDIEELKKFMLNKDVNRAASSTIVWGDLCKAVCN